MFIIYSLFHDAVGNTHWISIQGLENTDKPFLKWRSPAFETQCLKTHSGLHTSPLTWSIMAAIYRGADKSLARPGRKQATATEDFDFYISYL